MSGPVTGLASSAEAFAVGLLSLALVPLPAPKAAPEAPGTVSLAAERPVRVLEPGCLTPTRERGSEHESLIGEIRLGEDGTGEARLATAASDRLDAESEELDTESDDCAHVTPSPLIVENGAAPRP